MAVQSEHHMSLIISHYIAFPNYGDSWRIARVLTACYSRHHSMDNKLWD